MKTGALSLKFELSFVTAESGVTTFSFEQLVISSMAEKHAALAIIEIPFVIFVIVEVNLHLIASASFSVSKIGQSFIGSLNKKNRFK